MSKNEKEIYYQLRKNNKCSKSKIYNIDRVIYIVRAINSVLQKYLNDSRANNKSLPRSNPPNSKYFLYYFRHLQELLSLELHYHSNQDFLRLFGATKIK